MGADKLAAILVASLLILGPAGDAGAQDKTDPSRQTFDLEVCAVDGLTPAQCDCAWAFINEKMPARDVRLGMLLMASNSSDRDRARAADAQLDKSSTSDRKRDTVAQEIGALIIDAQDACVEM